MRDSLRSMVYACILAALTVVGSYVSLPIGPVPIVLANFFVLLAGILLGSRWGAASIALYLALGAVGLPVFAAGSGGLARFAGPTGGYLVGYLLAALLVGLISERKASPAKDIVALIVGALSIYALGVPWLELVYLHSWTKALLGGVLPFLPGDAAKVVVAFAIVRILQRNAAEFFPTLNRRTSAGGAGSEPTSAAGHAM